KRSHVVVHLRALLLAVVDDVEAGALEQADRVDGGPVVYLRLREAACSQALGELFVSGDLEPPAPVVGRGQIALVQRPAGECLHAPGRLGEAADLTRDEANAHATSAS